MEAARGNEAQVGGRDRNAKTIDLQAVGDTGQ
jgi:hypothetical protein